MDSDKEMQVSFKPMIFLHDTHMKININLKYKAQFLSVQKGKNWKVSFGKNM